MKRNDALKKIGAFLSMALGRVMEKLPWIKADKIICVSKHVKEELESLYGKRKNIGVIGAKADLKNFKPRNKAASKKKLGLDRNKWYGIYVGRGGFWTKGLDRVIGLSEEIYKNDKDFRLLVIGPDKKKVKSLIKHKFIIFISEASRDKLPYYYNSSDVFFNLSRYEGGDPTLSTAEAMASGCLVVCSKDARQDIIKNGKNGLVLSKFNKKELIKIMKIFNNPKIKKKIVQNALKNVEKILG